MYLLQGNYFVDEILERSIVNLSRRVTGSAITPDRPRSSQGDLEAVSGPLAAVVHPHAESTVVAPVPVVLVEVVPPARGGNDHRGQDGRDEDVARVRWDVRVVLHVS